MGITPQLIKDQEFQIKFRGCDPLEVRDYLETIADEFFELQEQCKKQFEELQSLREKNENTDNYTNSLETDMEFTRTISDELKESCSQKEKRLKVLLQEVEDLQLRIGDMEQEKTEHEEELSAVTARIEEAESALKNSEVDREILKNRMEILQEHNTELKQEEVNFKATLASVQDFAESVKDRSILEAEKIVREATAEGEKIRYATREELKRLPLEIAALKKKKETVKTDLKAILESYLETIDVFYPDDAESKVSEKDDKDELFQKISINENGTLDPQDLEKIEAEPVKKDPDSIANKVDIESLLRDTNVVPDGEVFDLKGMFDLNSTEKDGEKS